MKFTVEDEKVLSEVRGGFKEGSPEWYTISRSWSCYKDSEKAEREIQTLKEEARDRVAHVTGRTCDLCDGSGKKMDYYDNNEELVDCVECEGTGGWVLTQRELDDHRQLLEAMEKDNG